MHYLDNNATTKTCDVAKREVIKWMQSCSNPSGSSKLSEDSRKLLESVRSNVRKLLSAQDYSIIFTSGATESNCLIIRSVADAWLRRKTVPHIITSNVEHKSILECLAQLLALGRIQVSIARANTQGIVEAKQLDKLFRPNTALVTIIGAGNETGAINPLIEIATKCRNAKVPFHSDCVQLFGKCRINMPQLGLSALSMSFHKLYGPMGVGMLVIHNKLVSGYKLESQISGSQEGGLRGGTENVHGIAGAAAAIKYNFTNRAAKNKHLLSLKKLFLHTLAKHYNIKSDVNLATVAPPESGCAIVIIGPPPLSNLSLPNTILLSVLCGKKTICNGKMKTALEKLKYIVSIGSACNTNSSKASHVLTSLNASPAIKRGTLRISFGDLNTLDEAKGAAEALHKVIETCDVWLS